MYLKVQIIGSMYIRFSFENILVSYEYAFNIYSHISTFTEITLLVGHASRVLLLDCSELVLNGKMTMMS